MKQSIGQRLIWASAVLSIVLNCTHAPADDLASLRPGFQSPPAEARPTVWWRFMQDLMTPEGIVADVEAMKLAGVSGAVISYCDASPAIDAKDASAPRVTILTEPWWKLVGFTLDQARQRDLNLWFQACPGYATSGGPWVTPELSMQKVVWSRINCEGGQLIDAAVPQPAVDSKWNYYRDIATIAYPTPQPGGAIAPESVIDISSHLDSDGKLNWTPRPGPWEVVRFGHTTTGIPNHPATPAGTGLECDKMSRIATKQTFDSYFKKILDQRGQSSAPATNLFYDSWEAGSQNWTPGFRETFRELRGYDPLPWLLVQTGQLVGSEILSHRFENDWKATIEERVNTEHFAELARLSHEQGSVQFRGQPYHGNTNFMTAGAIFDLPEGEYWHGNPSFGWWTLRMIASVSHVTGKQIASAEALTSSPSNIRFDVDPYTTKAETDLAFASGINRMAIHVMPHNPWPRQRPGMIAGPYGPMLSSGQVWLPLARSWTTYLARCCYLLEQGTFCADVVTVYRPGQRGFIPPPGYASDLCNEELIISSMTWDGQSLCLPSGMRYRVLELADTTKLLRADLYPTGLAAKLEAKPMPQSMSLALLKKVRELVNAGATVVGPRPVMTPGLVNYPACDVELNQIADELWGPSTQERVIDRKVGKGRVVSGRSALDVLADLGVSADVHTAEPIRPDDLPWIHRRVGENELYFVSNQKSQCVGLTASFRVDGKVPELWHADTGLAEPARHWRRHDGRTDVQLDLDPRGSIFVVFRPAETEVASAPATDREVIGTIQASDAWQVRFDPDMGAPAQVEFPKLISWTDRPEKGIRYYSGIAVYSRNIDVPPGHLSGDARLMLDLGDVRNLARVKVNDTTFDELWKPPFKCDVTSAIKPGLNQLQVEVVNVWANRLVGDEQEPEDVEWAPAKIVQGKPYSGRPIVRYPQWVLHNKPRPSSERRTFSTWNFVLKDQPLLPSGMLGPVTLTATKEVVRK